MEITDGSDRDAAQLGCKLTNEVLPLISIHLHVCAMKL